MSPADVTALAILALLGGCCIALLLDWERQEREIERLRTVVRRSRAYLYAHPPIW